MHYCSLIYYMISRKECIGLLSLAIDALVNINDLKYYIFECNNNKIAFQCPLPVGFFDERNERVECIEIYIIPFIDSDGVIRIESYGITFSTYSICISIDEEDFSKDRYSLCYFYEFYESPDDKDKYKDVGCCLAFIENIYSILEEDYSDSYDIDDIDKEFDMFFRTNLSDYIHMLHNK